MHSHAPLFLILLNSNTSICGACPLLPRLRRCQWNTKPMFWRFSHGTIPTPSLSCLYCLAQSDTLKGNFLPIFSDLNQTGGNIKKSIVPNLPLFMDTGDLKCLCIEITFKILLTDSKREKRMFDDAIKVNFSSYCLCLVI